MLSMVEHEKICINLGPDGTPLIEFTLFGAIVCIL